MNEPKIYCRYTELRPLTALVEHPQNPNTHPQSQLERLADVIRGNGWRQPITVSARSGYITKGHGRFQAAQLAGFREVPVEVQEYDNEAAELADMLADNRIAELAEMDDAALMAALGDLQELDAAALALSGYTEEELAELLAAQETVPEIDEALDEVQEDVPPFTEAGDVWELGEHRLVCGDSSQKNIIERLTSGEKACLLFTDPPYGINRDKGFKGERAFGGAKGKKKIKGRTYTGDWDSSTPEEDTFSLILQTAKNAIIWGGNFFTDKLPQGNFWIVWDKHNSMPTFGDCELAWTNIERNSVKKYDVLYNGLIGKEKERYHPTQKPVKLCVEVLADFTEKGDLVYDFFGGSGTTMIAAQELGRRARLCELDPHYCDVIANRFRKAYPEAPVRVLRDGEEVTPPAVTE